LVCFLALSVLISAVSALQLKKGLPHGAQRRVVRGANVATAATASTGPLLNVDNNLVVDFDLGQYFIFYGNSFNAGGADELVPAAIQKFITDLSNSDYLNIVTQYYGGPVGSRTNASRLIHWVGQSLVGVPYGTTIGDVKSRCGVKIVQRLLDDTTVGITFNPTVQYYAVYGSDVTQSTAAGGCQDFEACGLHDQVNHTFNGVPTRFLTGWVKGDPAGCLTGPAAGLTGPNGTPNLQSILNTLAHEVTETITDPNQDPSTNRAWETADGSEIADLCSDYFGTIQSSTTVTGAFYNVIANSQEYLIQGAWSNEINGCAISRAISNVSPGSSPASSPGSSPASSPASTPASSPASSPAATSAAVASSGAVVTSAAATPSAFGPLPTSGCITFAGVVKPFRKIRKFTRVCTQNLGGVVDNTAGILCCNSITKFTPFSWSVSAINCAYPAPPHKLDALCTALGGHIVCTVGLLGAVRHTCTH